ncbi:MAG: RNA polymerase sigma factor [Crocinitomicaceae bacterium]|nr:RNA polymerase sigma factor [Crocinitomicaceae bacterium]
MRLFKTSYEQYTDESLMKKLASGEKQAFDVLYDRYASALFNYFYRMLWKDKEKAEDFVHDFFSKIIQKPTSFDTSRSFKTWMYSVANNMCKNEYKRQAVRAGTKNGLEDSYGIASESENAFSQTHFSIFKNEFEKKLNLLDEKHREAFIFRHIEGLSIKEIADLLKISEGTIKSRIFYATKHLAEELSHYQQEKTKHHG